MRNRSQEGPELGSNSSSQEISSWKGGTDRESRADTLSPKLQGHCLSHVIPYSLNASGSFPTTQSPEVGA